MSDKKECTKREREQVKKELIEKVERHYTVQSWSEKRSRKLETKYRKWRVKVGMRKWNKKVVNKNIKSIEKVRR